MTVHITEEAASFLREMAFKRCNQIFDHADDFEDCVLREDDHRFMRQLMARSSSYSHYVENPDEICCSMVSTFADARCFALLYNDGSEVLWTT